jgi:trehalose 6-phosphate phosphatase
VSVSADDLAGVVASACGVLARRPSGLFTDIDGTLSPIVPVPDEAIVPDRIRAALAALATRLELVVAVTGRAVEDARRMVGLDQIGYIGNHGIERWQDGRVLIHPEAEPYASRVGSTVRRLAALIPLPGVLFEDKGATGTIHYRLTPAPTEARVTLLEAIAGLPDAAGLRIVEGRMVINILPPLRIDKGQAIAEVVERRKLRGAVFLGDDVTDLDGMRALRTLRDTRGIATLGIAVLSSEGPPELLALAEASVASVVGVGELLEGIVAGLS